LFSLAFFFLILFFPSPDQILFIGFFKK
jgi:hypothetical protein